MAQQPEAVADILKRSQSQQGRTCPRCGRERAFVVNSAGRTVPLLAPCMHCYQGGPAEATEHTEQAADANRHASRRKPDSTVSHASSSSSQFTRVGAFGESSHATEDDAGHSSSGLS